MIQLSNSHRARTALVFRGYDVRNLGHSRDLAMHPVYGEIVRAHLEEASQVATMVRGRRVDLVDRVMRNQELSLADYDEAISLIMAMEVAEVRLLEKFFDFDITSVDLVWGYSLGEIAALVVSGVFELDEAVRLMLSNVADCQSLANDVVAGIVVSHDRELAYGDVQRACVVINKQGAGVVGLAAHLSANSMLLMGQQDTVARCRALLQEQTGTRLHLWDNFGHWPPLHTPILWQRQVPNRYAQDMHTMGGGLTAPKVPLFSLVTGAESYNDYNAREMVHRWLDQPQQLWAAIRETQIRGIERVIHVGPQPSLVSQMFNFSAGEAARAERRKNRRKKRLSENGHTSMPGAANGHHDYNGAVRSAGEANRLAPREEEGSQLTEIEHVNLEDLLLQADSARSAGFALRSSRSQAREVNAQ